MNEVFYLTSADGESRYFADAELRFPSWGNFGAPPTEFITRKGYKQTGVTEIDYILSQRDLNLELWRAPATDRQTYWDNRADLMNFLRPNRGPHILTVQRPDGSRRSITVRAEPGLTFPADQLSDNNWNIQEPLRFAAFDPIWYDPDVTNTTLNLLPATDPQLVFPATFPFVFGVSGVFFTSGVITYAGTWKSYPVMTLTGPYTTASLTNVTTGASLFMAVAIAAGEQRIIDLTPGTQSILDGSGNNRFSELGPGSNLIEFNLRPSPEAPSGQQTITFKLFGGDSNSRVSLRYNTRYLGI